MIHQLQQFLVCQEKRDALVYQCNLKLTRKRARKRCHLNSDEKYIEYSLGTRSPKIYQLAFEEWELRIEGFPKPMTKFILKTITRNKAGGRFMSTILNENRCGLPLDCPMVELYSSPILEYLGIGSWGCHEQQVAS